VAKIQTLGLPAGPVARGAVKPSKSGGRPDTAEYGASGTPIFGGFLRERGEYNPRMIGWEAISTYEEMRRSDAQVSATLMAIKHPIRAAQWDVTVDDEATPVEKEAAEFVRTCLFKELDFSSVLRNALLMLDFGVAAHEDVWEIVGNRVHLAKMAPRLPLTYYRWITDDSGEDLAALEQMGYRGDQYVTVQVPVDKLALFTYQQEGQNYTGMSLLRSMYQHWYIKSNLYKVDAIACERNGVGVPVITMGADYKVEDKFTALEWVQALTAHQSAGIVLPPGWLFELKGVTGSTRDPKDSIAHHNTAISMAGLAMFMMLGQSQHGSHSTAASMSDFFFMSLEATAQQIARTLTLSTVKRLVDFNFAGVVNYPRVVPQQLLTVKFETIVQSLKDLATSGIIEPDDTLESWMREKLGAPEVDKASVRAVPGPVAGAGLPVAGAAPGAEGKPVKPEDDEDVVDDEAEGGDAGVDAVTASALRRWMRRDMRAELAATEGRQPVLRSTDTGQVHVDGTMGGAPPAGLRREPRGAEKHLALHDIIGALDTGRDDVAAALRRARPRVQAEAIHHLVDKPVRTMHRVLLAPDAQLTSQVDSILRGVSAFGRSQVGKERASQLAGRAPSDAAKIRMADKSDQVGLYADGVVSKFTNQVTARAASAAVDAKRHAGDKPKGQVIQELGATLDAQSDKWIDSVASEGANGAFADGRQAGYEDYKDEIGSVIYSALLDPNTCGPCADADGQEGKTPDDIPDVPNPDCDGGDKCRCVQVFVFADEGKAA
jgi:phage gp29-like protein